jgi:clan AA aspartic protease (TIGR02281 family)
MVLAMRVAMRRWMSLALGVLIGQWLAFSGTTSPADVHALGVLALERHDYAEAARIWSRAVSLQPDNPTFHYMRATALARLGHATSAVDAYQQALLLDPSKGLARLANEGLANLAGGVRKAGSESIIPIQALRGVWTAYATLNDRQTARFLVDTGASVTLISPALAKLLSLRPHAGAPTTALQTVAGQTMGVSIVLASIRLGDVEARDVPGVIHDPGFDVDGILGNSFLGRFLVTLDSDRHQLHLRPAAP